MGGTSDDGITHPQKRKEIVSLVHSKMYTYGL